MRISRRPTTSTTSVIAAALLLALVAAGTVTVSSAAGAGRSPTSVTACAAKADGTLRLVTKKKGCRANERVVTWNKRGPRGASGNTGADGTDGAAGPPAPTGAPGASGYQIVEEFRPVSGFFFGNVYAACPAGKQVVGGGAIAVTAQGVEQGTSTFMVRSQSPTADGRQWVATIENNGTLVTRFVVCAICVSVSS